MNLARLFFLLILSAAFAKPQSLTPGTYLRWGGGTWGTNDCLKLNAAGRLVSAGAACGAGGGGSGITSLNALTGATQTFTVGTSGTNFTISSSGTVHTFNLPTASASNRGLLSTTDWSTFNNKESALTFSTPLSRSVNTISCPTCVITTNNLSDLSNAATARTNLSLGNVDNFATASQAEAEAGVASTKFMTPERVAQAIAALQEFKVAGLGLTCAAGECGVDFSIIPTYENSAGTPASTPVSGKQIATDTTNHRPYWALDGAWVRIARYDELAGGGGLVDPGGNGVVVRTALNTTVNRTLTGTSNEISVADGTGVSANPTISLPATIDLSGKTSLKIPVAAGAAPTVSGLIAYDSTSNKFEGGANGSNKVLATEDGNVATATALAANGSNCSAGQYPLGVDAGGAAETCTAAPSAAAAVITTQAESSLSNEVSLGALADNAIVTVDVSGSVATPRAAAASDVVAIFNSGTCSGYLKSNGSCDTPAGSSTVVDSVYFPAGVRDNATARGGFWQYSSVSYVQFGTAPNGVTTNSFANAADTTAGIWWKLPENWDSSGSFDIYVMYSVSSAVSTGWAASVKTSCSGTSDDATSPSFNTASTATVTYGGSSNRIAKATFSAVNMTNCAAGEMLLVNVARLDSGDVDAMSQTVSFHGAGWTFRRTNP